METSAKFGIAKRFGARYGRSLKNKWGKVAAARSKKQLCPFCRKVGGVKRKSAGIWTCNKCNKTFAGRAYTADTTIIVAQKIPAKVEE